MITAVVLFSATSSIFLLIQTFLTFRSVRKLAAATASDIENLEERLDTLDQREKKPTQPYRDPATGKEVQVLCVDCRYCAKGTTALVCEANPVAPRPGYKAPHYKFCANVNANRDCPDFRPKDAKS